MIEEKFTCKKNNLTIRGLLFRPQDSDSSKKYPLAIVSHDRYFMDKIADTLFIMEEDGSISGFVGKCSEYLQTLEEKKKEQSKNTKGKDFPSLPSQSAPRIGLSATPSAGSDAARNACSPENPRRGGDGAEERGVRRPLRRGNQGRRGEDQWRAGLGTLFGR